MKNRAPRPQLQLLDKTGCNWNMSHSGNAIGFERNVEEVLKAVHAEYNLSTEAKKRRQSVPKRNAGVTCVDMALR